MALVLLAGRAEQAKAQQSYAYSQLDVPGPVDTFAYGINNAGQIVGHYTPRGFYYGDGFLLSGGTYSTIDVPGLVDTHLTSISNSGQIVGWAHTVRIDPRAPDDGYLLNGWFTSINAVIPGQHVYSTYPAGINTAGDIVGNYSHDDHPSSHAFLLSGGNYTKLDVPGSAPDSTAAFAINNAGKILVGSSLGFGLYQPVSGNYTGLDLRALGTPYIGLSGLNDADQIVGCYSDANFKEEHGFVLSDGVVTNIDMPGAQYTWAYGINDLGQIVGTFEAADGTYHGFLASPTPEPGTLVLLLIGTLGIIGWARWRSLKAG
jgi:probable HAF family extracellular repeat protein